MYCENCKYFEKGNKKTDKNICFNPKFNYDSVGTEDCFDEAIYPLVDKVSYWDYDGYAADFAVGSKFGCIHFEEKE